MEEITDASFFSHHHNDMQHTSPKDVQRLSTMYTHPIYFSVRKEKGSGSKVPLKKQNAASN